MDMYMWVVKSNEQKAIDWFNYDGSFSPLAVMLSRSEYGEIDIIATTMSMQNQLKKFVTDREFKRIFPNIIKEEYKKCKSIREAFDKAISMNYLIASDERFDEAMQKYILQFLVLRLRSTIFSASLIKIILQKVFQKNKKVCTMILSIVRFFQVNKTQKAKNFSIFLKRSKSEPKRLTLLLGGSS